MKQELQVKNRVRDIPRILQQIALGKLVELRIMPYTWFEFVSGMVHRNFTPLNVLDMYRNKLFELVGNFNYWDEFRY